MLVVKDAFRECFACPSSWDIVFCDGRDGHIRFRWGYISVETYDPQNGVVTLYGSQVSDSLDGVMDFDTMKEHLKDVLMFDCRER